MMNAGYPYQMNMGIKHTTVTNKFYTFKHQVTGAYFQGLYSEPSIGHAMFSGTMEDCTKYETVEEIKNVKYRALNDIRDAKMPNTAEAMRLDFIANSEIVCIVETRSFEEVDESFPHPRVLCDVPAANAPQDSYQVTGE